MMRTTQSTEGFRWVLLVPGLCLGGCAGETPPAESPPTAPSSTAVTPYSATPPHACPAAPAKQDFDTVLKGKVAGEHRRCAYLVEAVVSSTIGGVYDHIVRPTPDEVLFEVCAPDRPTGEASCALVLAPRTALGEVPDMKQRDRLLITGTTMDVKGMWVLDARKFEKVK